MDSGTQAQGIPYHFALFCVRPGGPTPESQPLRAHRKLNMPTAATSHALLPPLVGGRKSNISNPIDKHGTPLAELTNRRVRQVLMQDAAWHGEARTAQKYYRSDQYRRDKSRPDRSRIRLIANFIRRDIDMMVAEVLDGKPVVEPSGRRPKDYEIGRLLIEVLQWTRDEEENWDTDLERVITDQFHIGEGVLFEGWDQDADGGRGMPKSLWLDARYVLWPMCKDIQRDDAEFVVWLEHEYIETVVEIYPQIKDMIHTESFEVFMTPTYATMFNGGRRTGSPMPVNGPTAGDGLNDQKVWIKRMWSKKRKREKIYFYIEDSEPAYAYNEAGDEVPLSSALYGKLSPQEQDQVVATSHLVEELWETVVINDTVVEHRLSPFDKSKGGHGKYPFAFFSCVLLADEARARGEIGWLVNVQDIINENVTMMLDQLFMANIGYFHVTRGSLNPEERQKLEDIPRKPFSVIETAQGMNPPSWQGMNPGAPSLFVRALDTMSGIMDKISGIHEPSRGQVSGQVESGRAIRALQSRSSLLTTKTRRHIEAGLRRSTLLRLYNISQFMRGNRLAKVVDEHSKEEKPIFIGSNELEVIMANELVPAQDERGKTIWKTLDDTEAKILILNDRTVRDVLFEQIRLKLDTGIEMNKLERTEQAQMVLQTVGPPAIPWAATQMNWTNRDQLIADIERADESKQLFGQLQQLSKETKLSPADLMQLLVQTAQQKAQMEQGGPPPAGAPPGMPPGAPPGMPPGLPPELMAMMAGGPPPGAAAPPEGPPPIAGLRDPQANGNVNGVIPGAGGGGVGINAA